MHLRLLSRGSWLSPLARLVVWLCAEHPPAPASATWDWTPKESDLVGTAFLVPTQVNYVGKYARLVDPTVERIGGHTAVIDNLLRTGWLWEKVRVTVRRSAPAAVCLVVRDCVGEKRAPGRRLRLQRWLRPLLWHLRVHVVS